VQPHAGFRVVLDVARVVLLIALYLAAGIAFLIAVNADPENLVVLFFITVAAAAVVGWGTGRLGSRGLLLWVLLPWVIVPLGLPFGGTIATGGDDYYEVAALAAIPALVSMVSMLLAAGARLLWERHRHGAPSTAA
jgi:hypothetical protein